MPKSNKISWKTLRTRICHRNPWYVIRASKVIRPDGKKGEYYVLETPGPSVFVIALNAREEICLIKMHRYPTKMVSWEIPGGNSEGQNLLKAAKRELWEETGFKARKWKLAGKCQPMNGVCSEIAHVFIARGLYGGEKHDGLGEGITEIKFVPFPKIMKMVTSGKITDGQTLAGLLLASLKK